MCRKDNSRLPRPLLLYAYAAIIYSGFTLNSDRGANPPATSNPPAANNPPADGGANPPAANNPQQAGNDGGAANKPQAGNGNGGANNPQQAAKPTKPGSGSSGLAHTGTAAGAIAVVALILVGAGVFAVRRRRAS